MGVAMTKLLRPGRSISSSYSSTATATYNSYKWVFAAVCSARTLNGGAWECSLPDTRAAALPHSKRDNYISLQLGVARFSKAMGINARRKVLAGLFLGQ